MQQTTRMLSDEELAQVLSPRNLPLPAEPKVVEIKVAPHRDWTGDDSLEVYVILDDATPEQNWKWLAVEPIDSAIRAALEEAHESRFPYFRVGRRQDYDNRYSYDPGEDE